MIAVAIVVCEIAFWVLLLGGLTARYPLRRPRLGAALLVGVPLVDVVLLAITAIDIAGGAQADWTHGLAAVYVGFSVVFGPMLVQSLDRRFAGRPRPRTPAEERLRHEWRLWARCLLAAAIACVLLGLLVLVGGREQTRALWEGGGWFSTLGGLCAAWLAFGPVWELLSPRPDRPDRAS